MTKRSTFPAILLFFSLPLFGQQQDIDTVYIFDSHLKGAENFHKIEKLKSEDLQKNTGNLSEILRFQSPIYIKENGRGMVGSPSFRGTTAQQTAIVWNGISINSAFLGQGDLNNISVLGFDELQIKSGGGSVYYGSGAIGGTIHLNNELAFNRGLHTDFFAEQASFNTWNSALKTSFSNENFSVKASATLNQSDNDYEIASENYKNLNGAYRSFSFNLGAAVKLNDNNSIFWQTQHYDGFQHYPVFSEYAAKSKNFSNSFRTLADWQLKTSKVKNSLKLAYLQDEFQYYENITKPQSSGGNAKTYLAKEDFLILFNDALSFNFIGEIKQDQGEGYQSGISEVSRNAGSVAGLFRWNTRKILALEAGIKKEFVQGIASPLLFSLSTKIKPADFYHFTLNFSKNFRYPSFNDLYWQPGGNTDLQPEISYQTEMGNNFKLGDFKLNITPFYLQIENMLRWLPGSGGMWFAQNTNRVESYGVESQLDFNKKIGNHQMKFSLGHAYTHSSDQDTGYLLPFVPAHKVFGNAMYRYGFADIFLQGIYNSKVYTDSEQNQKNALNNYFVFNAGINTQITKNIKIGFKVQNIFNEVYETMPYYPLPLRNYSFNLLLNI